MELADHLAGLHCDVAFVDEELALPQLELQHRLSVAIYRFYADLGCRGEEQQGGQQHR
jgi:hypothetical protein